MAEREMDDAEWVQHLGTITDPVEALRTIVENEFFFGYDSYYSDLRGGLLAMANRIVDAADEAKAKPAQHMEGSLG